MKKAISALAIAMLAGIVPLGLGCGGSDDSGSERAVEWALAPPVGPNWIRISAVIEGCDPDPPLLEEPIIEYKANRVYIELRRTPEDGKGFCFLNLVQASRNLPLSATWTNLSSSTRAPIRPSSVGQLKLPCRLSKACGSKRR